MIWRDCGRHSDASVGNASTVYSGTGVPLSVVSVPLISLCLSVNTIVDVGEVLAAAHLKRRVGDVAAADGHRLQHPGPRAVARPDQVRAGRDAADREVPSLSTRAFGCGPKSD